MPPHALRRSLLLLAALGLAPGVVAAQGAPAAQQAATRGAAAAPARPPAARAPGARAPGTEVRLSLPGEWQVRLWALSDLPLATTPGETEPATLGQRTFLEQWFRFSPELSVGDTFRVVSQFDLARGIVVGDSTRQVELSRDARTTEPSPFPHTLFDLRWLYLDWTTPLGVLRAGQQGAHWGLGIVANDGNHRPVFGDYRMGDIVERVAFATRPFGRASDVVLALTGDLVVRDRLTSLWPYQVQPVYTRERRTLGGDWAWQFVTAVFYQDHACRRECERKRVGIYGVYRDQRNRFGDDLRVYFLDAYARWEWPTPDGAARIFAAVELAGVLGSTTLAADVANPMGHLVEQFGGAAQVGVEREGRFRVTVETGFASGDRNPTDEVQRRFTFNPSHRVGLILFPEVIAWQTARSASIASDERLLGRPARGAELFPSSGGVTNAAYIYPTAVVNVRPWLDVRAGMVVAVATTDLVDPVQLTTRGVAANFRGGDARNRDLGLEFDLGLETRQSLGGGVWLTGGLQGGVFFPGRAFDDAAGRSMGTQALLVGRAGLQF